MAILSELLTLIEKIPATFWGVVVGSFFSILGVALTNRASDRRLRTQFSHERELKTKDREMMLKKEIYLAATEAIAAGTNAIGRFANLDLKNDQITEEYIEKAPAISKVHVIAKIKTVQAIVNLTGELGATFLLLFSKRFKLMAELSQIRSLESQMAEFGKERDLILEMIKQYNIEGIIDDRRWQVLQGNFDFEQKKVNDALTRYTDLGKSLFPKQLEFMRECISETARLGALLIPALIAVREELELPFDEDAYRQVVEQGISKQEQAVDAFILKFMPTVSQPVAGNDPQAARGSFLS